MEIEGRFKQKIQEQYEGAAEKKLKQQKSTLKAAGMSVME
jgi:hypothetical protein